MAMVGIVVLGAAGSGAAQTTEPVCGAKPICITITDQAGARVSTETAPRYMGDTIRIYNGGTSNLVNITLTATWEDFQSGIGLGDATTSTFRSSGSSPSGLTCSATGRTLTCTTPKSLPPGTDESYTLVFKTATTAVDFTRVSATVQVKERSSDKLGNPQDGSNESADTHNDTPYVTGTDDADYSWVGGDLGAITLVTPTAGNQTSTLPVPAGVTPGAASVVETTYPSTSVPICRAPAHPCIGQQVSVEAVGVSPVNLRIVYEGPVPGGFKANDVVVLHTRSDGTLVPISATCSGAFYTQPATAQIPCRRVTSTKISGGLRVTIDAWDISNGDWKWG